jgi:hypothetical protein
VIRVSPGLPGLEPSGPSHIDYVAWRYVFTDKVTDKTTYAYCRPRIEERDRSNRPTCLKGVWEVIGRNYQSGTVELKRGGG